MKAGALIVSAVLLGACGGGSSPPSPKALADKINCDVYELQTGQIELGAREQAWCEIGEERLTILTYKSNEPRDSSQKIAEELGGGIAVVGDRFVVRVDSQAMAERVKKAVGGEIR